MKKAISIILNILSIISAVITLVLVAFCIYDWFSLASTPYAYTVEFWLVIDYYAIGSLIFAGVGLAAAIPNCFIAQNDKSKKQAKILSIAFAFIVVISVILYILPISF